MVVCIFNVPQAAEHYERKVDNNICVCRAVTFVFLMPRHLNQITLCFSQRGISIENLAYSLKTIADDPRPFWGRLSPVLCFQPYSGVTIVGDHRPYWSRLSPLVCFQPSRVSHIEASQSSNICVSHLEVSQSSISCVSHIEVSQ